MVALTASQPVWRTGRLFRCLSASSDGFRAGLTPQPFSQPEVHSHHWHSSVEQEQEIETDSWGCSGAVGNNTANVTTRPGSNPGDPEAALASGSRPLPLARWFQWKICRGPLDEQKIPRGGARAVQPGMPFPNLYWCNKVLVNQNKK